MISSLSTNENLRDVLPYLRPRSAELTPFSISVLTLLCVGIAAIVFLHYLRYRRHQQEQQLRFVELGREMNLADGQIHTLLRIGRQRKMNNPLMLLNSVHVFDQQVGAITERMLMTNPADRIFDEVSQIRSQLEFDSLPPDHTPRTTRQLAPGLTLMVLTHSDEEASHKPWLIVARDERGIQVAPLLKEDTSMDTVEASDDVTIRFWRDGDTEYSFSTEVMEVDRGVRSAVLRHVKKMERLELREFFRLEVSFNITLFPLRVANHDDEQFVHDDAEVDSESEVENDSEASLPDPENLRPVEGEVLDISAGGMRFLQHGDAPRANILVVATDFKGPFPLAGIRCAVTSRGEGPDGTQLQLKFLGLPRQLESEIVKQVYQSQVSLSGRASVPSQET